MTIQQATTNLYITLDNPYWLTSMGVGRNTDGRPAIVVYYRKWPHKDPVPDVWQGYPVIKKFFGEFAPQDPREVE